MEIPKNDGELSGINSVKSESSWADFSRGSLMSGSTGREIKEKSAVLFRICTIACFCLELKQ